MLPLLGLCSLTWLFGQDCKAHYAQLANNYNVTKSYHRSSIPSEHSFVDSGPTLNQHWFNVLCLLGTEVRL